jgi:hypothetical protein
MSGDEIENEVNRRIMERMDLLHLPPDILQRLPTADEMKELRKLMEQDARTRWLWSSIRTWVLAISAVIALFTVGFDGIRTILRRLVA